MKKEASVSEKIKEKNKAFEVCVLCGAQVEYNVDTPISVRKNYIQGSGQLCCTCMDLCYGAKHN